MRLFLIPLLLASAALPAAVMAQDSDRNSPRAERGDRAERSVIGNFHMRASGGERSAEPRPDLMRQRVSGGMSNQAIDSPRAPRQMRMGPADVPSSPPQADRRMERQQRWIDQQRSFGRPGQAARGDWADRAIRARAAEGADQSRPAVEQDGSVRTHRNRGPRVITTDGLPSDASSGAGFGRSQRIDRITRNRNSDAVARGGFASRLDRERERNLARRSRMPGLPPGQVSTGYSRSGDYYRGGEVRRSSSGAQWGTSWRNDRRYDWQDWRRRHRSSFHIGFYSDPFGLGYQRLNYGWRLYPSYYQSSYWLSDPWQYRLPPAYGPYRWVRYWHDAVLVDIYSGEVVDVIYDFFW